MSTLARRAAHLRAVATVLECLDRAHTPPSVHMDTTVKLGPPDTHAAIGDVATAAETFCTTSRIDVRDVVGTYGRDAGREYTAVEVTVDVDGEDVTLRAELSAADLRAEAHRLWGVREGNTGTPPQPQDDVTVIVELAADDASFVWPDGRERFAPYARWIPGPTGGHVSLMVATEDEMCAGFVFGGGVPLRELPGPLRALATDAWSHRPTDGEMPT